VTGSNRRPRACKARALPAELTALLSAHSTLESAAGVCHEPDRTTDCAASPDPGRTCDTGRLALVDDLDFLSFAKRQPNGVAVLEELGVGEAVAADVKRRNPHEHVDHVTI
jgi:hypothetical protein